MQSYGQQKKEGTIQNEEFVTEKVRKIEVQPTLSRSFEALNEIPDYTKDHKVDFSFDLNNLFLNMIEWLLLLMSLYQIILYEHKNIN